MNIEKRHIDLYIAAYRATEIVWANTIRIKDAHTGQRELYQDMRLAWSRITPPGALGYINPLDKVAAIRRLSTFVPWLDWSIGYITQTNATPEQLDAMLDTMEDLAAAL